MQGFLNCVVSAIVGAVAAIGASWFMSATDAQRERDGSEEHEYVKAKQIEVEKALAEVNGGVDEVAACQYRDSVLPAMRWLRAAADAMETRMPREQWPFPTYGDMLFSVK